MAASNPEEGDQPGAQGESLATESRPYYQEGEHEEEGRRRGGQELYRGEYVVVRKRGEFLNAYPISDPEIAPAELMAHALKELLQKYEELKADNIIWLPGPGFRIGVAPDKRIVIMPAFGKKVVQLSNIVKFMKHMEKVGVRLE